MKDIYIIVHEEEVRIEHDCGIASSISAYCRIQEIKTEQDYRTIDGDPTKIPNTLPPPNECKIHLCGSSIAVCIPQQQEALQKAGYTTRISRSASIF